MILRRKLSKGGGREQEAVPEKQKVLEERQQKVDERLRWLQLQAQNLRRGRA